MNNNIDIAISFDTTGSMYPCITEVRKKITDMVTTLFNKIGPKLRIAIIAHGDYCDKDNPYTIRYLDFSQNPRAIVDFINGVKNTHGGDADECYELVLHVVKHLSWKYDEDTNKALILIGDANPHGVDYPENKGNIDWLVEATDLASENIKIYACHAMADIRRSSTRFYKELAETGKGAYLTLSQFSSLPHLLMGIMYKEADNKLFEEYVQKVEIEGMSRDLHVSFTNMGSKTIKPISAPTVNYTKNIKNSILSPVSASRFQIFKVHTKQSIKDFVNAQHVMFQPGRGFYELTKSVKVQQHKEIILVHKKTKDIYTGPEVRKVLGLLPQVPRGSKSATERLSSFSIIDGYNVFIQSTSYNRELLPGTLFMYEIDGWDKDLEISTTTVTGRTPYKPDIASIPRTKDKVKKEKNTSPKYREHAKLDFTNIEQRIADRFGMPITMAKDVLDEVRKESKETHTKTDDIPAKLHKPKQIFEYKQANPDMTWGAIADKFEYGSGSGARKAAKRYSDYISK